VLGFILACVPGIGLSMILIAIPFCFASFILGVVGAATGRPLGGILLIIGSVVSFGLFQLIPWLSTMIGLMIGTS
jgi:hypothetical protein